MEQVKVLRGTKEIIGEIPAIHFGTVTYEECEGAGCQVISLSQVSPKEFAKYVSDAAESGYICHERHCLGTTSFYAFSKKNAALFLNYYPELREMRIVGDTNCGYFQLKDRPGGWQLPSLLTQIDLEDYGMSYLIRMSDGRFLILDGGWDFEPDADKLMRQLQAQAPEEKPVIAAWIFTHPHIDHYRCFMKFFEKYKERVIVEAFLYNFPEITEEFASRNPRLQEKEEAEALQRLEVCVAECGAPVIRPHTGQVYQFGNVRMEVLSSLDDTCHPPCGVNAISLVLRMQLEGQQILFCADSELSQAALAERYGSYLKSDILQVTHHGFNGGTVEAYSLIDPEVCLVPVDENLFYGYMCCYKAENQALIYGLDVKEILTGSHGDIVLTLPYKAKPNGRTMLLETAKDWQKKLGARSWVFGDMTWETCRFSILNTSCFEGSVKATLYFEERADRIRAIEIKVPGYTVKKVDFTEEGSINGDSEFFNRESLSKMGIPYGKTFAVHFLTDRPLVIWGDKAPVYVY